MLLRRLFDFISPRYCAACEQRLSPQEEVFCVACNMHLPRTRFAFHPTDNAMTRLLATSLAVSRAVALFVYKPQSPAARVVYQLKYYARRDYALAMGAFMARELAPSGCFDGVDLLLPVPLSRERQRARGYNQSEGLAFAVADMTGIPMDASAAMRLHFHRSQTALSGVERRDNVAGAFSVTRPQRVAGRHVMIVDDVFTTGATTGELGRELMKAGASSVSVLTLCFASGV